MAKKIFVGTSGFSYPLWKGNFYPEEVKSTNWLQYYSQQFNTLEVNSSYYRQPSESTLLNWKSKVNKKFIFSIKAHRYLTFPVIWQLKDDRPFKSFYDSISVLENQLGPILYLFLPTIHYNEEAFLQFVKKLDPNKKTSIEVRHNSWINETFFKILKDNNISLCVADTGGKYIAPEKKTSNFMYVRLHGPKELYASSYNDFQLKQWANKIKSWGLETFLYMDNDFKGYAPENALRLQKIIKGNV